MESPYRTVTVDRIASQCGNGGFVPRRLVGSRLLTDNPRTAIRQPMDIASAKVPVGRVHIISARCKQCNFCINYCPTSVLAYSTATNAKGYHFPVVAEGRENACINCKFCDLICPELAIFTTDALEEATGAG